MAKEKNKGPKPVEIAVSGVLSLLVGLVGAAVFLAFQPIKTVQEIPPVDEQGLAQVYSVRGKSGTDAHDTWKVKKEAITQGRAGEFELVEQELNRWASSEFRRMARGSGMFHIHPAVPNFRIADDRLHIEVSLEWNVFGGRRKLDSQVSGVFRSRGGVYRFVPDRVHIGSSPLPRSLGNYFLNKVVAAFDIDAELREGWRQIQLLSIEGNKLRIGIS